MSSRTVSVVLTAQVANYLSNMRAAEERTRDVERASRTATQQFRAHQEAMQAVGVGMVAFGGLAAAGMAVAIKASAEFGAKMAQLQSLSHSSAGSMKQMSDAAMSLGTAYGFTATQVADAEIELQKAGVGVAAQLGGALKGALSLAAAGQLDVAQATEITTVAMTQFGLSAKDVPHLADLLAAGADKALGSVGDLGEALKNGGLQAHNMGLTLDDTVGLLSAFANSGILGAEAGTQMRSMFLKLQNPTAASRDMLKEHNIALNDAQGKFVGVAKLGDELRAGLGKLTDAERNHALAVIFGSHAITGATVLYQDSGKAAEAAGLSIADWTKAVNEGGFANAQAAGKMNSLTGDVQKLSAAFQNDLIKAGNAADGPLRGLTQTATGLVGALGDIPPVGQTAIMVVGGLTAAVGVLGGGALLLIPKITLARETLTDLGISGREAGAMIGKGSALMLGLAAAASGFVAMGEHGTASAQQVSLAGQQIANGWKGLDKLFAGNGFIDSGNGVKGALDQLGNGSAAATKFLDGLTFGLTHFSDVYKGNEAKFDAMGQQLGALAEQNYGSAASSFSKLVTQYHLGAGATKTLLDNMPAYRDELIKIADKNHIAATDANLYNLSMGRGAAGAKAIAGAQRAAAAAAQTQQTALNKLAGSATTTKVDIGKLQQAIEGFGSATLDARGATRAFYQAIDDADAAVKKNGRTLDVHTQKGRDNQAALDGIASAADAAAGKILKETGSTEKAAAAMSKGRTEFIRVAEAMGLAAPAANRLADKLQLIPSNVKTAVSLTGVGTALDQIGTVSSRLRGLDGKSATVTLHVTQSGSTQVQTGGRILRAAGGPVDGPGQRGVDSVPAMLAPGEHVLTSRDVDRLGGQGGVYRFRAALETGAVGAFAAGGATLRTAEERVADAREAVAEARTVSAKRSAAKRLSAAERHLSDVQHDANAQDRADEQARLTSLAQGREDFVSAERRTPGRRSSDPLAYVDQLRSMSRDDDFSKARQKSFDKAANKYEAALVKLSAASDKASAKLADLRAASTQLHDSIRSAIFGGYRASDAAASTTHDVTSGWVTRNGMRFQTASTVTQGPTAASVAAYYTKGAADAKRFATDLATLAKRGYSPTLLTEVAGYGVEQGAPIVAALLSASKAQVAQINAGYRGIYHQAGLAGTTVADDVYAKQIAAADKRADKLAATITADGEKLRKLIARAFGLKGYATGTPAAASGIRWVGEDGPELIGFHGGERVLSAPDSQRWVRGSAGGGSPAPQPVNVTVPAFPDTITVQDASGFRATMRVVAHEVVTDRHDQIAVRLMGAA